MTSQQQKALNELYAMGTVDLYDEGMQCILVNEDKDEEVINLLDKIGYKYFGTDFKPDNKAEVIWWTK